MQSLPKESSDIELSSDDHRDGSVQKHARAGSGYEFYPAQDLNPDAEKGNGQKENRSPPVKDTPVDTNRKPQEDEDKPLKYKWVPPPYTKDKLNKSEPSDATNENHGNDDHVLEEKPKAKSVRTRSLMPLRGEENGGDGTNKEKAALGQRILKFFDGGEHDQPDEDEKNLDKLLEHYSRKKGPHESSDVKPTHQRSSMDLGNGRRNPAENPKVHSRAASFHPDGHVHPKLPDYDDFVARLAAYRGK